MRRFKYLTIALLGLLITKNSDAQNGSVDSSFGINGIARTTFFGLAENATAQLVQPDDKILIAGYVWSNVTFYNQQAIVRFMPDGTLDSSFGNNGKVIPWFYDQPSSVTSMALRADGRIVIGGYTKGQNFNNEDFAIYQMFPDGNVDYTFGFIGKVILNFDNTVDKITALVACPDNKLIAVGAKIQPSNSDISDYLLTRLNADGSIDETYGNNGVVQTNLGNQNSAQPVSAILLNDGKLLVGGYTVNSASSKDFIVVKYDATGKIDSSFGTAGTTTINFDFQDRPVAMKLQADEKIVIAGYSEYAIVADIYLLITRLKQNGALDSTFGVNGKVTSIMESGSFISWLDLHANGNIDLSGSDNDIVVYQFKNDGTRNTSFGTNGRAAIRWDNVQNRSVSIGHQSTGKIIVSGISANPTISFAVSRFNNTDVFKTASWTGNVDSNWHNPSNWTSGKVPDAYTNVTIHSNNECVVNQPAVCHAIQVLPGSNINLLNNLTSFQ